jgi:hypothetical protein
VSVDQQSQGKRRGHIHGDDPYIIQESNRILRERIIQWVETDWLVLYILFCIIHISYKEYKENNGFHGDGWGGVGVGTGIKK